jgi:hypothetical protein
VLKPAPRQALLQVTHIRRGGVAEPLLWGHWTPPLAGRY